MAPVSFVVCFAFSLIIVTSQWKAETEVLNRAETNQAIAVHNHILHIIGGYNNPRQLVQYDTRTNTITSDTANDPKITTDIVCNGQAWVQNNELLYLAADTGTYFAVYNLVTNDMTEWNGIQQMFPHSLEWGPGCLALYNGFLFVVGGGDDIGQLNTTQIFNITDNAWLSSTPTLNEKKNGLACIIHPKTEILYTFGGRDHPKIFSSIELLYVNDMANIGQQNWQIFENILVPARTAARVVIYGNDILIIGGALASSSNYILQNQVFYTVDNTVEMAESMTVKLAYAAVVMTENNTVYTVGGRSHNGLDFLDLDTIQSIQLPIPPTTNPTVNPTIPTQIPSTFPTQNPTQIPSKTPTQIPSVNPTQIPSVNPTIAPSKTPNQIPSKSPTQNPLNFPTKNPSVNPTKLPTIPTVNRIMDPSKTPTQNPSKIPSQNPSEFPTQNPLKYPTKNPSRNPTKFPAQNTIQFEMDSKSIFIEFSLTMTNDIEIESVIETLNQTMSQYFDLYFDVVMIINHNADDKVVTLWISVNNLDSDYELDGDVLSNIAAQDLQTGFGGEVILDNVEITDNRDKKEPNQEQNILWIFAIIAGFVFIFCVGIVCYYFVLIRRRNVEKMNIVQKMEDSLANNAYGIEQLASMPQVNITHGLDREENEYSDCYDSEQIKNKDIPGHYNGEDEELYTEVAQPPVTIEGQSEHVTVTGDTIGDV